MSRDVIGHGGFGTVVKQQINGRTVAVKCLQAADHPRKKRVFHRDIKPSNILLGHLYQMKLCDFGLSKVEASEYSGYGVVGTLRYTPPEALGYIEGQHLFTHASDLYAAGLVLWETIERRIVYSGPKAIHATLVFRICYGDPLEKPKCRDRLADLITRCCSRELEKRPTATDALKEILEIKESQFYDLFLMDPIDDPNSPEPKLPFGSMDDSDLNLIATMKPKQKEKPPVTSVASVVLGKTKFEQLQQVFNGTPLLRRSTSAEELANKKIDKPSFTPLRSPIEEDEEVTPTPMSLSNKDDETIIAKKEMEIDESREQMNNKQPFITELKAAFIHRYINVEKFAEIESENLDAKPGTSKESQKSEDDSGFLEKSSEFEPRLTPVRLAPTPPLRAPIPQHRAVIAPRLGWNDDIPKLRNKPLVDEEKARDRLLHRRSLPNTEWKPPVPPRRTASPALQQKNIPEPPPRKVSLHRGGWVSDELLIIWCKNLVAQHPTWSADLLKQGISHIIEEKSEAKMESFMARVLRNEAAMPSPTLDQRLFVLRAFP
ncbi:unnamed protein product, partial [Mesorhabditis belari]|uniref:Protein kinase domain-containing protein n=1 Tax=Mesorhabditis belari TaxID=2138241 RepID=A0AAF3EA13_9BILA